MSEPKGYYTIVHGNIVPDAEPQPEPEVCGWKYHLARDWDEGYWRTACKHTSYFAIPETHFMEYCPFCGKQIKVTT
jgi:hypothetical protein